MLKRGLPDSVFVDNGKIFVSRWFHIACARLNVRHIRTAPYSPSSKGKIERFMGTVDAFLAEMRPVQPKTLAELNRHFFVWLEEAYNHKPHAALDKRTPAEVFAGDKRQLRFISHQELREAFLWEEDRRVDRTGCLKLGGLLYDAGPKLAGHKVEIRFDPFDVEEIEVWVDGKKEGTAKKLALNQPGPAGAGIPDDRTSPGPRATWRP